MRHAGLFSSQYHCLNREVRTVRIAILEDDPDQLALLKRWITDDGHDVHPYLSGREAMKYAGRESFDLFMLDWQGPHVSRAESPVGGRAQLTPRLAGAV